jgi:uncharacterized protein (DUF4213/DUF364 family)
VKIIDELLTGLEDAPVEDVRVGVHWTAVKSGGRCGLAKTTRQPIRGTQVKDCGALASKSGLELAEYLRSWNFTEASVGLAALNSLIEPSGVTLNAFDFVCDRFRDGGKKIVLVGHFPDKDIEMLKGIGEVCVLERKPHEGDLPDTAAEYVIPSADVVMITATALINKTLPRLLELSENSFTVLFGPSTPMSDVFFRYGVDALGGARVLNPDNVLKKISEGAHLPDLKDDLEFLVKVRKKP